MEENKEIAQKFLQRMKLMLDGNNVSIRSVAFRLDLNDDTLYRWFNGHIVPSYKKLELLEVAILDEIADRKAAIERIESRVSEIGFESTSTLVDTSQALVDDYHVHQSTIIKAPTVVDDFFEDKNSLHKQTMEAIDSAMMGGFINNLTKP